jgi:hypothetical protein
MMVMSTRVILSGWRPGLRKVALATLLRERTGMSLHEAHQCVNQLLDDQTITVDVPTANMASAFAHEAGVLGVRTATVDSAVTT